MERPEAEFFSDQNVENVNFLIARLASGYSGSMEIVGQYLKQNDPELQEGLLREVKEIPGFQKVEELLGTLLGAHIVGNVKVEATQLGGEESQNHIEEDEYLENRKSADVSSRDIVGLVVFMQENVYTRLVELELCDTDEAAAEMSWKSVWGRLVASIKPLGGGVLADVADLFDDLVRQKYHNTYDPVDIYRGRESRNDISTKTFYNVFGPHLNRAIMRSGEDGWTGH